MSVMANLDSDLETLKIIIAEENIGEPLILVCIPVKYLAFLL